jgi:hypothetical protein
MNILFRNNSAGLLITFFLVFFISGCGHSNGNWSEIVVPTSLVSPAYFVSPSGSDTNSGAITAPWRTLTHAVAQLKAGDTLYARAGSYAETVWVGNSGTASSRIMISAYPGESPIIDGSTLNISNWKSLLEIVGSNVTVSGFEIANINTDGHGGQGGTSTILGGYGISITGTNDTVSNMLVHNTWAQGILGTGNNSIIQDSTIYYVAMSNCRTSGQTNCNGATLYPSGGWPSCVSVAQNYGSGLTISNATIQRNTVHDCWGEGVSTWLSNGTIIQDNVSYNNWAQNLYVNNATNALVQRNLVYNTANNYVGEARGLTLADEITTTTGINPTSSNNTVINNILYNAPLCAFCWTQQAGTGLKNVLIANNTIFYNFTSSNTGYTNALTAGSAAIGLSTINSNSYIINNIVTGVVYVPSATGLTFSNNLWAVTPSANATGTYDVIGSPLLSGSGSATAGQLSSSFFSLQSGSPAISKGTSLTSITTSLSLSPITTDFTGSTSMKTPPNIGAFQSP